MCCYFSDFLEITWFCISAGFSPRTISVHEIANCSPDGAYGYICVWYDFLYFHYARVSESVCVPEPRVQCWYAAYFLCWQRESIFIKWLMFLFLQEKNKKRWKKRYRCRKWQRSKYWSLEVCSQKLKICLHVPSWLCLIPLWRWPVLVDSLSVREENCLVAGRKVTQRTWPHRGPTPSLLQMPGQDCINSS